MKRDIYFAIPGDLEKLTGGYGYDRRIKAELEALGHKIHYLPLSPTFPKPNLQALQAADLSFANVPDGAVLLVDGLAYGVLDDVLAKHKFRLKLVSLCHHPLALESGISSEEAYRMGKSEARALSMAAKIITTSRHTANVLISDYGVRAKKIVTAVPGTDPAPLAPCKGKPLRLLTVATLTKRKAHDILIQALATLKHLEWEAHFVGPDDVDAAWTQELLNMLGDFELEDRVHIQGPVVDISEEYIKADLFVLPSLYEGYGMVFAEALAHGIPIVAANAGAVPDLVPASAGVLVTPKSIDSLREALETLFVSPSARASLQQGAKECAKNLPSWRDSALLISTQIEELLAT